jgi:predicted secreted hydrolase
MRRRPLLAALWPAAWAGAHAAAASAADNPPLGISHRALLFPADHGAHRDTHVEWWYVTGWLRHGGAASAAAATPGLAAAPDPAADPAADPASTRPDFGFQVTFFRTRTGVATTSASRFAARQLVFAHVALTDLARAPSAAGDGRTDGPPLMHDQRIAREGFGIAELPAADGPQVTRLFDWSLARAPVVAQEADRLEIAVRAERFTLALTLHATQPLMLQGDAGYSQRGPLPRQASHYYSQPQLAVHGRLQRAADGPRPEPIDVAGRAWLDHEWSDEYLPPEAVGWDWIGFNLFDGGALMAFRVRRPDGSALWAGGSHRDARGTLRTFAAGELHFRPGRTWTSPRTGVRYPVEWLVETPVGTFRVSALADDQELDSRGSTGVVYWEGLSALHESDGRPLGWGYLELTGYADRMKM